MIGLSSAQLDHIRTVAERAYPDECCGLLVGHDAPDGGLVVTRIVDSANVRRERARDRFEIDPQLRITLERDLRGGPLRVVGHYHSHPDHAAQPSDTDRAMVFEPKLIWLIVAVTKGHAEAINAFRFDEAESAFGPVTIRTGPEPDTSILVIVSVQ